MQPRIYVDFNTMNMLDNGRVYVGRVSDAQGTRVLSTELNAGMSVTLYDEEMEVEAIMELVEIRPGYIMWQALPDWATRQDVPYVDEV